MTDPVMIDLARHETAQVRAEARYDVYGERAIQSIVDDLLEGRKVARFTIHDFVDLIDSDDLAALLLAKTQDDKITRLDALREKVMQVIRDWCDRDDYGEVDERVRELDTPPCRCRNDCTC